MKAYPPNCPDCGKNDRTSEGQMSYQCSRCNTNFLPVLSESYRQLYNLKNLRSATVPDPNVTAPEFDRLLRSFEGLPMPDIFKTVIVVVVATVLLIYCLG